MAGTLHVRPRYIYGNVSVFRKSFRLWDSVEETQNTLLHLHCNSGYANAPQCYVIRTLCLVSNISGAVFANSTLQMVVPIACFISVVESAIVLKKGAQLGNLNVS
jgi:hypothetical protein